jgi:DNA-binding NarL/FixJ family response regulator
MEPRAARSIAVLLVDDDPDVRSSLAYLLAGFPGLSVVGCFDSAESARAAVQAGLIGDVALVDLGLPGASGHALIRWLKVLLPACECIVLTVFEDADAVFEALRCGARGYLLKDSEPAAVAQAVADCRAGGAPMSPRVARRVVGAFEVSGGGPALTSRELEVLTLLAKGLSYREIGEVLEIGTGTVQTYIKAIYRKLDVTSKAEAAIEAERLGLVR